MRQARGRLQRVLRALAEPRRIAILKLVHDRELAAGEIAEHFRTTRQAVSQHLKVLREAGLVNERRDGTRRLLSVRPEGLADLHGFLAEVVPSSLERLKRAAEDEERHAGHDRN